MSSILASAFNLKKKTELNLTEILYTITSYPDNLQTTTLSPSQLATRRNFSSDELTKYSNALKYILYTGMWIHLAIMAVLFLQQFRNQISLRKSKKKLEKRKPRQPQPSSQQPRPAKNNYVTFAFVFHQVIIDLLRITYSFFYVNSMEISAKSTFDLATRTEILITTNITQGSIQMNNVYHKHCVPMALVYSVLNMVTVINILSILISETCRFYDLKLSATDTSNSCCVIFGVILIWISSLITISSLMLVGVADSAAPTWKCSLSESESTTRFLVINITWFLLVTFVVVISLFYSCSLYKELSSLDYSHHRLSIFTMNTFTMNSRPNAKFFSRHLLIVNETSKRLKIFILLIVIFVATFMPNFVLTMLKNVLPASVSLKPFNLIAAILNQANPTLNSMALLVLCLCSNDNSLNKKLNCGTDSQDTEHDKKFCLISIVRSLIGKKQVYDDENDNMGDNGDFMMSNCATAMMDSTKNLKPSEMSCINTCQVLQECNKNEKPSKPIKTTYSCANDMNEFYSKIGSRLGRDYQ